MSRTHNRTVYFHFASIINIFMFNFWNYLCDAKRHTHGFFVPSTRYSMIVMQQIEIRCESHHHSLVWLTLVWPGFISASVYLCVCVWPLYSNSLSATAPLRCRFSAETFYIMHDDAQSKFFPRIQSNENQFPIMFMRFFLLNFHCRQWKHVTFKSKSLRMSAMNGPTYSLCSWWQWRRRRRRRRQCFCWKKGKTERNTNKSAAKVFVSCGSTFSLLIHLKFRISAPGVSNFFFIQFIVQKCDNDVSFHFGPNKYHLFPWHLFFSVNRHDCYSFIYIKTCAIEYTRKKNVPKNHK